MSEQSNQNTGGKVGWSLHPEEQIKEPEWSSFDVSVLASWNISPHAIRKGKQ